MKIGFVLGFLACVVLQAILTHDASL